MKPTLLSKRVSLAVSRKGKLDHDFSECEYPSDKIFIMQSTWFYSILVFHIWQKTEF
jgi:hypothetical protein